MHTLTRLRRSGAATLVTAAAASALTSIPTPAVAATALPTGFSPRTSSRSGRDEAVPSRQVSVPPQSCPASPCHLDGPDGPDGQG
jgi:hypothetical protein